MEFRHNLMFCPISPIHFSTRFFRNYIYTITDFNPSFIKLIRMRTILQIYKDKFFFITWTTSTPSLDRKIRSTTIESYELAIQNLIDWRRLGENLHLYKIKYKIFSEHRTILDYSYQTPELILRSLGKPNIATWRFYP